MSLINTNFNKQFPAQKLPYSKKDTEWRKKCVDTGEKACLWRNEGLRKSYYNKVINYNLYSDILDQSDIEAICNPFGIKGLTAPAKMQNYPIVNPKIDLLVGESINRKLDFKVRVINEDAISLKEDNLKKELHQMMINHLNGNLPKEEIEQALKNFKDYMDFEYQDTREKVCTQILKYLYEHNKLDNLFSHGFKDALLVAEEVYLTDVIGGEPKVFKINPKTISNVSSGQSPWFEDSDIINITDYISIGQILDEYHDEITPDQIDALENYFGAGTASGSNSNGLNIGRFNDMPLSPEGIDISILSEERSYGGRFDNNGNVRRSRVYWKSMRKLKKVKYYDAQGDEQYELYDENYKIDKSKGEEEEILWVSEWWEGHKIGGSLGADNDNAIYLRMRVKPVQFRSMENPSTCHPGIVGRVYNTNDNLGVSLMDRMKPYQYLYNILAYRTELMIAKNYGKIMRLPLHEVPENWEIDKWLSFAQGMNIAVVDAFKEGNKGASQGKLAGAMNQLNPVIDMEMGNSIQLYMNMMQFIKNELGEISGVSQSRQGQIHNRQAVGNVETEMTQSSMITEYWFAEHELVKIKVLECLLETAKFAWKDKKNKKIQYVLDDGSNIIINLEGTEFTESEYGLKITNSANNQKMLNAMQALAQAGLQNDKLNFSQLLDIYSTDSISAIRRKLERAEREKQQRDQQIQEQQAKLQQQQIEAAQRLADDAKAFEREKWAREDVREDKKLENELEKERLRQDNKDSDSYIGDDGSTEITIEQLRNQALKNQADTELKKAQLAEQIRHNKKEEELKEKDINTKKNKTK